LHDPAALGSVPVALVFTGLQEDGVREVTVPWASMKVKKVREELAAKPDPLTVTTVPTGPLDTLSVRLGLTVKVAVARAPPASEAAMVCAPWVAVGTVKVAVHLPVGATNGLAGVTVRAVPVNVTLTCWPASKRVPWSFTEVVPTEALVGVTVRVPLVIITVSPLAPQLVGPTALLLVFPVMAAVQ
jgi:hypothetical protein